MLKTVLKFFCFLICIASLIGILIYFFKDKNLPPPTKKIVSKPSPLINLDSNKVFKPVCIKIEPNLKNYNVLYYKKSNIINSNRLKDLDRATLILHNNNPSIGGPALTSLKIKYISLNESNNKKYAFGVSKKVFYYLTNNSNKTKACKYLRYRLIFPKKECKNMKD